MGQKVEVDQLERTTVGQLMEREAGGGITIEFLWKRTGVLNENPFQPPPPRRPLFIRALKSVYFSGVVC